MVIKYEVRYVFIMFHYAVCLINVSLIVPSGDFSCSFSFY